MLSGASRLAIEIELLELGKMTQAQTRLILILIPIWTQGPRRLMKRESRVLALTTMMTKFKDLASAEEVEELVPNRNSLQRSLN